MSRQRFDVLALGCTAVDEILYVDRYPDADAKAEVRGRERHCGGLAATALVAAARLGARTAYAGTLGEDEDSRFVLRTLRAEGVDTRHVVRRDGRGPVRSVIVVDPSRRTRNIFYDTERARGADARLPSRDVILSTRVLLVDRFGIPGMIRAARVARAAGIPVVADFESSHLPRFGELLALPDHLILSAEFACRLTQARTLEKAATRLWEPNRKTVVITAGAKGYWVCDDPRVSPRHFPAVRVNAVDTTGCGDVFHGAYAASLARGKRIEDCLQIAAAAAALKATKHGGQAGIPTEKELNQFLRKVEQ